MIYEVRDTARLIASTGDAATALLLAREWLRDPEQIDAGTHTCLVQMFDEGHLVGEHVVALKPRPAEEA